MAAALFSIQTLGRTFLPRLHSLRLESDYSIRHAKIEPQMQAACLKPQSCISPAEKMSPDDSTRIDALYRQEYFDEHLSLSLYIYIYVCLSERLKSRRRPRVESVFGHRRGAFRITFPLILFFA